MKYVAEYLYRVGNIIDVCYQSIMGKCSANRDIGVKIVMWNKILKSILRIKNIFFYTMNTCSKIQIDWTKI